MANKGQFEKGRSGNPAGRPKNAGKVAKLRALLDPHAEDLVKKAKDMALEGDMTALRLCLDRLVPPIKIKDELVSVPGLNSSNGLVEQGQAVIDALASSEITPGEAATLMQTVANQARIIEVDELERRITALESKHGN